MAEVRKHPGWRLTAVALTFLTTLLLAEPKSGAEEKCDLGQVVLAPMSLSRCPFAVDVPADWDAAITEFGNGLLVDDRAGHCRLEIFRERGHLDVAAIAGLYEGLYLGDNSLSVNCATKVLDRVKWTSDAMVGEYRTRARKRRVLALFTKVGEKTVWMFLKCKDVRDQPPPWKTAVAIFASYRDASRPHAPQLPGGGGTFGPLYFFLKSPLKRVQTPESTPRR